MLRWLALVALLAAGCVSAADAQESLEPFFELDDTNTAPYGIWSDRTTMWVADFTANKLFAYHMSNMSRYGDNDINLYTTSPGNTSPTGIWSNGDIMWVADGLRDKLFGYHMSNKSYDPRLDFNAPDGAGNEDPAGIWSDGTTMWVADTVDDRIYAYFMSNKSRVVDGTRDFVLITGNHDPLGIWSDGATMWVVNAHPNDHATDKIYSYNLATKKYDGTKDFDTLAPAGRYEPGYIWSDGATMWASNVDIDFHNDRIYAYKMYPAPAPPVSPPRVFVYIPPPDTTPPTVRSVERTGGATTTNHTLTWDVKFSESVRVGLKEINTNYTSVANVTIPDLGMVYDTLLADVPGVATGGSVSVDLNHPITSGLLIELVAPDCTKFTIHNQTTTFQYKLRQPYDLGDLSGVGAAGQWTLHVSDHAKYWNGTLNGWTLNLESRGVVEGSGRTHTITQYVAGPGEYTLSLDGFDIRDRAGNRLADTEPAVNESYLVVGTAVRACHTE